jgi:hypothetical protein
MLQQAARLPRAYVLASLPQVYAVAVGRLGG